MTMQPRACCSPHFPSEYSKRALTLYPALLFIDRNRTPNANPFLNKGADNFRRALYSTRLEERVGRIEH
jgi:hypothetical protein